MTLTLLWILAALLVLVGLIGIVLPGLPGTPVFVPKGEFQLQDTLPPTGAQRFYRLQVTR